MNIVGPLANPAGAGRQVMGVSDPKRVGLIASALQALGTTHALVVHGEPGMDEISPLGPTHVVELRDGTIREWNIDPAHYGLAVGSAADLAGGTPAANAALIELILGGGAPDAPTAAVVLNAAAALLVAPGGPTEFGDAVSVARAAVRDGVGLAALRRLRVAYGGTA